MSCPGDRSTVKKILIINKLIIIIIIIIIIKIFKQGAHVTHVVFLTPYT